MSDDLIELLRKMHRLIPENFPDHPVVKWYEKIGNGIFEDDYSLHGLPAPGTFFRFRRDNETAYLWFEADVIHFSPWHPMRGGRGRKYLTVGSVREALDMLDTPPPRRWRQFFSWFTTDRGRA